MALCMEVGLGSGHTVLDGDPARLPKKGAEPPIFAHFYCGQMAGCIKMPFGMEVGFSPCDFVLDVDSAPSPKWGGAPHFRPMSVVAKWTKMPLGMEVGLGPGSSV